MRKYIRRNGYNAIYVLHLDRGPINYIGFTIWRQGAISFLLNGVPLQIVIGDWWKAHPESRRSHAR